MDKVELKIKMQELIKELEVSLPSLKESAKPVELEESIGRLTRMDAIGAQAINKKNYENAKNKLVQLGRALSEIDSDDFGLCMECEEPINFKRILAVPESRLCINCASGR